MTSSNDTIAALSTAPGDAGIAVVRMSGPLSLMIADNVFRGVGPKPSARPANTFVHGYLMHPSDAGGAQILDEVILLLFRAPHSYTCEDVVELQGHGGRVSARRLLQCVLDAGARLAEPGEFTKRAFLNGRIDLMQAEAVADLIRAQSDRAVDAALEQLDGHLSRSFLNLYAKIVDAAAHVEASLDFAEEDTGFNDFAPRVLSSLDEIVDAAQQLLATWQEGRVLREGARLVIAGRPNVGKSTLLNALLGSDRAIVTEIPGTTRDTLEESIVLDGVPIRLIDTAGLRDTTCRIEQEGIRRSLAAVRQADVVLCVLDGSQNIIQEELTFISNISSDRRILIVNKSDLGLCINLSSPLLSNAIACCLRDGTGLDSIRKALRDDLHIVGGAPPHAVISSRHRELIQRCLSCLQRARDLLVEAQDLNAVPAASELRRAAYDIGSTIGKCYTDDVLNSIFSTFCLGK